MKSKTPADLDINEWQDFADKFHARWPYTVRFTMRIENTQLTSARYAGGMTYNGAHYTYFEPRIPGHEPNPDGTPFVAWLMVRDDFLRFVRSELNRKPTGATPQQQELFPADGNS